MKKKKPDETTLAKTADKMRRLAEKIARDNTVRMPERQEAPTSEEARQTLHELRVHQIELEMQNEELRRIQADLDAARARYFDLYDLAPVGYLTVSEMGLILEANLTAATMLGVEKSTLVKQPLTCFILRGDQDIYYKHRKLLFKTGIPQLCEIRLVKKDGSQFWALLEANVEQDANGVHVYRVVVSNITKRRKVEEALQKAHDNLERQVEERTVELRTAFAEIKAMKDQL